MYKRHPAAQERRRHRRACVGISIGEHGVDRTHPRAAVCIAVQHGLLEKGTVERVDEQPPRLGRAVLRPQLKELRLVGESCARLEEQLRIRRRNDVLEQRAVPVGAQLACTHHVGAVPDVATVGGELKVAVGVHGQPSLSG